MIVINPYRFAVAPSTLLTGLTASYSLDGNATKNVGTNNGTATNVTYTTGTISGQCGVFNGTSKVSIADSTDFTFGSSDFAFFIRIKRGLSGTREIFTGQSNSGGSNSSISWWIEFTSGNKVQFLYNLAGAVSSSSTTTSIADTNWHNIIVMRDGVALKIYIDGVLDVNANAFGTSSINDSSFPWGIGNAGDLASFLFTGSIQDVHLWNGRKLTASEITELQTKRYPFT